MATYAIGDVQGCFAQLEQLLAAIQFDLEKDTLWFTGDLVNRGSQSLAVLRFVKSLGDKQITVLGNHDLHLLAIAYGVSHSKRGDTLDDILSAPDRDELINWLRCRPLLHVDASLKFVMAHAGLAPAWNLELAARLGREVEMILQGNTPDTLLKNMYGNQPDSWSNDLTGPDRWRCIVNFFTRMRFCYADGRLDLSYKGEVQGRPEDLIPWYEMPRQCEESINIIFGHWAALDGQTQPPFYALDTGCVWGGCLTALRLEDKQRFSVSCNGSV